MVGVGEMMEGNGGHGYGHHPGGTHHHNNPYPNPKHRHNNNTVHSPHRPSVSNPVAADTSSRCSTSNRRGF